MSDTTTKTYPDTKLKYNDGFERCSECGLFVPCEGQSPCTKDCSDIGCDRCVCSDYAPGASLTVCTCGVHPDDIEELFNIDETESFMGQSIYRNSQRLRGLLLESQQDHIEEVSALNVIIREKDDHIDTLIERSEEQHKIMRTLIDDLSYTQQLHKEACIDRDNNKTRLRELRSEIW